MGIERPGVQKRIEPNLPIPANDEVGANRHLLAWEIRLHFRRGVGRRDLALGVEQDRERKLRALGELSGLFPGLLNGDDQNLDAAVLILLVDRLEMRSLRIAEGSPPGTEMENHDLAAEVCQGNAPALEALERNRRRRVPQHWLLRLPSAPARYRKQSGKAG